MITGAGKIYILRNPYLRDAVIKIGKTSRASEKRAEEISVGTGVPYQFEVLYEEDVFDADLAEKLVHKKFSKQRINPKREFFRAPLKTAVRAVFETCLHVNRRAKSKAGTRIVVICRPSNTKLVGQMREELSKNKGGVVEIFILYQSNKAEALLKLGKQWNIRLSAELINNLRSLRGVKDVLWVSRDVTKLVAEARRHPDNLVPKGGVILPVRTQSALFRPPPTRRRTRPSAYIPRK